MRGLRRERRSTGVLRKGVAIPRRLSPMLRRAGEGDWMASSTVRVGVEGTTAAAKAT